MEAVENKCGRLMWLEEKFKKGKCNSLFPVPVGNVIK
jgi:hypothetical protein